MSYVERVANSNSAPIELQFRTKLDVRLEDQTVCVGPRTGDRPTGGGAPRLAVLSFGAVQIT